MALIKCHECQAEISDQANVCPHCGYSEKAAVAKKNKRNNGIGCLAVIGIIVLFVVIGANSNNSDSSKSVEKKCNNDDLACLGDAGVISAGVYCKDNIEKLSLHDVKWTDGTFEQKFSRFRWKDQSAGIITYIGDRPSFKMDLVHIHQSLMNAIC